MLPLLDWSRYWHSGLSNCCQPELNPPMAVVVKPERRLAVPQRVRVVVLAAIHVAPFSELPSRRRVGVTNAAASQRYLAERDPLNHF